MAPRCLARSEPTEKGSLPKSSRVELLVAHYDRAAKARRLRPRKRLTSDAMTITMSGHLMVCDNVMCDTPPLTLPNPTWPERRVRNWSEDRGWRNDDEDHDYCPKHADGRLTFDTRNEIA
jgi:hypothetical protein